MRAPLLHVPPAFDDSEIEAKSQLLAVEQTMSKDALTAAHHHYRLKSENDLDVSSVGGGGSGGGKTKRHKLVNYDYEEDSFTDYDDNDDDDDDGDGDEASTDDDDDHEAPRNSTSNCASSYMLPSNQHFSEPPAALFVSSSVSYGLDAAQYAGAAFSAHTGTSNLPVHFKWMDGNAYC